MTSILILGFMMGMRHALDADHLTAVATLATRSREVSGTVLRGVIWGIGHTVTLLLVGGACLAFNAIIPESIGRWLEIGVGLMLVALGTEILWRLRRDRIHIHPHSHTDGLVHVHAHRHTSVDGAVLAGHDHPHPEGFPIRAMFVGMMHGLAGSAALVLLLLQTVSSPWTGLAYLGLFGAGSIIGMGALSVVIAFPLQASARSLTHAHTFLRATIAVLSVSIGLWVIYIA